MRKPVLRAAVIAVIFLFVGVASAAAVFEVIPEPGSAPSIFDDFRWSSTSNGFWHVNAVGAKAIIKRSVLTLEGDSVELDHRVQTDPNETIIIAKLRGLQFKRFGMGIGVYHAGTVGAEFDDDGAKCGRGTDFGWRVDILKGWTSPPAGQWFYLAVDVINPYPNPKTIPASGENLTPVTLRCSLWDMKGRLLATDVAKNPEPNTHYIALDEAFLRTWDSGNKYQIDWVYVGPPSGDPVGPILQKPA